VSQLEFAHPEDATATLRGEQGDRRYDLANGDARRHRFGGG
jgi:hypothetical protein